MGSPRQEYWRGLPFPPPEDLPDPGIKPPTFMSPALAGGSFTTSAICVYHDDLHQNHYVVHLEKKGHPAYLSQYTRSGMDWMPVSPAILISNLYVDALTPNVMVFGGRAYGSN